MKKTTDEESTDSDFVLEHPAARDDKTTRTQSVATSDATTSPKEKTDDQLLPATSISKQRVEDLNETKDSESVLAEKEEQHKDEELEQIKPKANDLKRQEPLKKQSANDGATKEHGARTANDETAEWGVRPDEPSRDTGTAGKHRQRKKKNKEA